CRKQGCRRQTRPPCGTDAHGSALQRHVRVRFAATVRGEPKTQDARIEVNDGVQVIRENLEPQRHLHYWMVAREPRPTASRYCGVVAEADVVVWYNPRCSKCRGAEELLAEYGVSAQRVFYLDNPPHRTEINRVLELLGATDPRELMRTAEPRYRELGLGDASADE